MTARKYEDEEDDEDETRGGLEIKPHCRVFVCST